MKKLWLPIVLTIVILLLLTLPLFTNGLTTEVEKTLLNLFISMFSVYLGFILEGIKNEKKLSEKWMPAAQNAAFKLVTLSAHAKVLINSHKRNKQKLDEVLPDYSTQENIKNIKSIIDLKCDACAESMVILKDSLDTSLKEWETFIDYNCEKPLCIRIHEKINDRKAELGLMNEKSDL